VKPIFEVSETAIGGNPYAQITMPDGTSDQIYGFDSRDKPTEWRNRLKGAKIMGCGK
jgi:hypothetical protein